MRNNQQGIKPLELIKYDVLQTIRSKMQTTEAEYDTNKRQDLFEDGYIKNA
jgi:hypothetical protein